MEGGELCLGFAENNKYSSPMPVIGVYIMTSTLVCLLFLISDALQGYRHKKSWLPCRFFSLNSLTLTLLGVSTKLPVDLTTPMPSFQDQLSKLCGTLLICVSMGFFMPSLAEMEGFELFGNMASLTILVVTVIVNISIQMSTGVIFSFFFVEHIVALFLLLLTIIAMWYVTFMKNWIMGSMNDIRSKSLKTNYDEDEGALSEIKGLQHNYEASYFTSPQLALCISTNYVTYVGMVCILSVLVILVAFFRTFSLDHLKFCEGESDYTWSMWMLVAAQILTVVVATLAIMYRAVFFACRKDKSVRATTYDLKHFRVFTKIISNWKIGYLPKKWSRLGVRRVFQVIEELVICILFATQVMMGWTNTLVSISIRFVRKAFAWLLRRDTDVLDSISPYLQENARKHVTRWIQSCEEDYPTYLTKLLSKTKPSEEPHLYQGSTNCLLLVFLVRIAAIAIPSELCNPLIHALDEIFEILYFIGERMSSLVFNTHLSRKVAKDLWMSRDFKGHWFQKEIIDSLPKSSKDARTAPQSDHAIGIIKEFTKILDDFPVLETEEESRIIKKLIKKKGDDSIHSLCDRINRQFVDILYLFLRQLPSIITKYVSQSPAGEREERLEIALKFMCKFDQLKPYANWLSSEINISQPTEGLITTNVAPPGVSYNPSKPFSAPSSTEDLEANFQTALDETIEVERPQ